MKSERPFSCMYAAFTSSTAFRAPLADTVSLNIHEAQSYFLSFFLFIFALTMTHLVFVSCFVICCTAHLQDEGGGKWVWGRRDIFCIHSNADASSHGRDIMIVAKAFTESLGKGKITLVYNVGTHILVGWSLHRFVGVGR